MPTIKRAGTIGLRENYAITVAELSDRRARNWQDIIEACRFVDSEKARHYIDKLNKRYGAKPLMFANLVPTVGRTALAARLANTTTYTNIINKCALGTSSAAPANGDTTLGAEVYRNNAASLTYASNIAYITGFFTAAETNGTYGEVGFFIDGTASANTGQLFSRTLISVTKSAIQTLTIDATFTFS